MSSDQSVPKTIVSLEAIAPSDGRVSAVPHREPKGDVSGKADPLVVAEACKRAQDTGAGIVAELGALLAHGDRRKVLSSFRRILFPPGRPGRRPKETVTAAHRDWKNGVRAPALYRAHIPGWGKHNRYRRQSEARALMDAVRTRDRRERKRTVRQNQNETEVPSF
jgi:hypothetical protein